MRLPEAIVLAIFVLVVLFIPIVLFSVPSLRRSVAGRIHPPCSTVSPWTYRWRVGGRFQDLIPRFFLPRSTPRDVELGLSQLFFSSPRSEPHNTQPDSSEGLAEHTKISLLAPNSRTTVASHGSKSGMSPELTRLEESNTLSSRKDSDGAIGTSSLSYSGVPSFFGAAVIPKPSDPSAEDEIWNEYDIMLVESHVDGPKSASSSEADPFALEYQIDLGKERAPVMGSDHRNASRDSNGTDIIRAALQPHHDPHCPAQAHIRPESCILPKGFFGLKTLAGELGLNDNGNVVRLASLGEVLGTG
ncbi:hypothetical protein BGZ61DRAFT_523572 [Ilyonectria robusta]|uniref:uncharacterized protein n=1 Tax=Ilyonectria robusta TaxID=1079257 RepID=UPI001E8EEAF2|nr:uncharacterized protein BGZ61DRAFT_523572 [Ilyonectria robusta]KAH8659470.1 hypothetical protein BGZ61DRAFT_523572 [Ilyonectria robusta]